MRPHSRSMVSLSSQFFPHTCSNISLQDDPWGLPGVSSEGTRVKCLLYYEIKFFLQSRHSLGGMVGLSASSRTPRTLDSTDTDIHGQVPFQSIWGAFCHPPLPPASEDPPDRAGTSGHVWGVLSGPLASGWVSVGAQPPSKEGPLGTAARSAAERFLSCGDISLAKHNPNSALWFLLWGRFS